MDLAESVEVAKGIPEGQAPKSGALYGLSGSGPEGVKAVEDLLSLPIARFPTGPLMIRAYELRSNVTPYDATYVALAEGLSCPLVTADARLARAPGIHCAVDVLVF